MKIYELIEDKVLTKQLKPEDAMPLLLEEIERQALELDKLWKSYENMTEKIDYHTYPGLISACYQLRQRLKFLQLC